MPLPTIYINLEDDVSKIITRVKKERGEKIVLVCPKRCFLFNDSINLRLLKKQTDLLGKTIFILTMDERGQMYAKEAGFELKQLPGGKKTSALSDIRPSQAARKTKKVEQPEPLVETNPIYATVSQVKKIVKNLAPSVSSPKVQVKDIIYPKNEVRESRSSKATNPKFITALVALSLIVILLVVFVVLPKASVTVHPKSEPITRDMKISLTTAAQQPDVDKLILPATKINETVEVSDKFESQGKQEVGNKATGQIRIYNFTRSPLNLKAATTSFTIGNKTYYLTQDLSGIRVTKYKNEKTKEVDEASLDGPFDVVAASGGESFNVPAGTRMEITNQVLGSNPQFLFAKTETAVTGGTTRFLSVVSEQDVASAQSALGDKIVLQIQDKLKSQGLSILQKGYSIEQVSFMTDKPVGTESPTFQATLKARITGLAYNEEDLQKLISDRISQTVSSDKTLAPSTDPVNYKLDSADLNTELATINVHYEGRAVFNINLANVAKDLTGKSQTEVNEILRSRAEIQQVDINLAPSWQKSFPWFAGKIEVKVAD